MDKARSESLAFPQQLGGIIDHLGIVVPDLQAACVFYRDILGFTVSEPVDHADQGIAVAFVQTRNVRIELLTPTCKRSPIEHVLENHTVNHFLARQPQGGIHHVAYVVEDLLATRDRLSAGGFRTLGSAEPIIGATGQAILFLDPSKTGGTLIELKQAPR